MPAAPNQQIFLVRHGETEWSISGQHTGRTDIPLTARGERQAVAIGHYLAGRELKVLTSPLGRARETCRLAGLAGKAEVVGDLREWDYGIYEGRTTSDIRASDPSWSIWLSPITDGESLQQVAARAQNVIDRVAGDPANDYALFAHGHILRILGACWIGHPPITGRNLALETATVGKLGYERQTRVIWQWNTAP